MLRLLSTPGTTILVAENDKGILGFISLWSYWGLFNDSPKGIIDRVVIHTNWQASSVPQALLEQALGACQAMGCSSLKVLSTKESSLPRELLEEFGFENLGNSYSLGIS